MDLIGGVASGICAIHCVAIPVILSLGTVGGLSFSTHNTFDVVVMIVTITFGIWASVKGYSSHSSLKPIFTMLSGALILVIGWMINNMSGHMAMGIGGSLLAIGHYWNYKLRSSLYLS